MSSSDDMSIMAQVITMYYEQSYSQQEIADRLFYSRSKISRMLQRSKELGIVEVNINYPVERMEPLEEELTRRYGLNNAIVVKHYSDDYRLMLRRLCTFAAGYIDSRLQDGMTIGLSWGTTVYNLVKAAAPKKSRDINVVQLVGAINESLEKDFDPSEMIRNMAVKYNGSFQPLYAPLYVENSSVSSSLRREPLIAKALECGRNTDMLITGISYFNGESRVPWEKFLTREEKAELLNKGAVGIYLAHFINKNGAIVSREVDERVMGIQLADVKKSPCVITIAAGRRKVDALLAALRGGYVNVLIVDDELAELVLADREK